MISRSGPVVRNGFTLIELMVVITLLALAAGAVVLTVGSSGSGPKDSADRLASRLAAARDEAIVGGKPMSVWISASGYGFEGIRNRHWESLSTKPFLTENWPEGTSVNTGRDEQGRARLRFDNLGMANASIEIQLARGGQRATVTVGANGDVMVE